MSVARKLQKFAARALHVPFVDRGRSWAGWDCWGLLRQAYLEVYGVLLPDDNGISCHDIRAVKRLIKDNPYWELWPRVDAGQERPGDVALFAPWHTGLIVAPGLMLHVREDIDTVVERYHSAAWAKRLEGIYRYAGFAAYL